MSDISIEQRTNSTKGLFPIPRGAIKGGKPGRIQGTLAFRGPQNAGKGGPHPKDDVKTDTQRLSSARYLITAAPSATHSPHPTPIDRSDDGTENLPSAPLPPPPTTAMKGSNVTSLSWGPGFIAPPLPIPLTSCGS